MQEYCVSKKLFEVKETQPAGQTLVRSFSSRPPNSAPELAAFVEVRKWYAANLGSCRPFWLYKGLDPDQMELNRKAYDMYARLSAELHTEYPADKVRALLPVLMNIPVEFQGELDMLVTQILEHINSSDDSLQRFLAEH
eukprot:scaffold674986_cov33-Prasinocladus_malaysianus.AAC.1